nr:uncharacterized protein LOC109770009 [Aegilops tauschii subsp. strangulata]
MSDSSGPPVRCHASQSAHACALTRTSRPQPRSDRTGSSPTAPFPSSSLVPSVAAARVPDCRPPHHAANAMVLEDESSDDQSSLPYMHSSSSTDGLNQLLHVPSSLEDPDYKGLELDLMSPCEKHVMASERLVAMSALLVLMLNEGNNCGFVEWVDHQWPPTMQNAALLKLWAMVEGAKSARVNDSLESALAIHNRTEEKNKLEANYDKLVQDVHELMNFQEERVIYFSYLQSNLTYQQEVRKELIADMKAQMATEMAKKDAETQKLTQKYELLVNLTRSQAIVIQNLKLNNMKEKQVLIEARMNLELKNAELTKCQEKLTQEKLELKLKVADLLKGKEKHIQEKFQLELQNAELMMGNEKLKEKFKGIQAILEK